MVRRRVSIASGTIATPGRESRTMNTGGAANQQRMSRNTPEGRLLTFVANTQRPETTCARCRTTKLCRMAGRKGHRMKTQPESPCHVGSSALFVLGVPVAEIELCWFRFTPSYDGCIHHAARGDGNTFCGLRTSRAEFGGRTLGDDSADGTNRPCWPSCLRCAASLRKHGLRAPWERTNDQAH